VRLAPALILLSLAALSASCGGTRTARRATTRPSTSSRSAPASSAGQPGAGTVGPEGMVLEQGPQLAPASSTAPGTPVDGIQCAPVEQLVYHIHVHLQVYVDGQPRELPPAIGLVGPVAEQTANGPFYGARGCYYWLHVHVGDGVIHVESPSARIYTLGNFFDEWRQPLSSTQVASAAGPVTAFVDGRRWTKSPRDIPLVPHAVIQLDVGTPIVPFQGVSWAGTGL
jgi:hypothetical protein